MSSANDEYGLTTAMRGIAVNFEMADSDHDWLPDHSSPERTIYGIPGKRHTYEHRRSEATRLPCFCLAECCREVIELNLKLRCMFYKPRNYVGIPRNGSPLLWFAEFFGNACKTIHGSASFPALCSLSLMLTTFRRITTNHPHRRSLADQI